MKNYGIALLSVYALNCGGAEVKKSSESEKKKPEYVVRPVVVPAPKCWREGMTGPESLECLMSMEEFSEE